MLQLLITPPSISNLSLFSLRVAPWLVLSAIDVLGGQRPVIMGKGYLVQKNYTGSNYVEWDIDIGSSSIAKSVGSTVMGYSQNIVMDEAFVVEGKEEVRDSGVSEHKALSCKSAYLTRHFSRCSLQDELPERMLVQHEFRKCNLAFAAKPLRPEDYIAEEEE